jgi:tetratricopeptide (TPR) repeat protein
MHEQEGLLTESVTEYREALALAPGDIELRTSLVRALESLGDWQAIIELLEQADPNSRDAWLHKKHGDALAALGKRDDAAEAYRAALEIRPGYPSALVWLAQLKTFSPGDRDLDTLERALTTVGLSTRDAANLHFAVGKAYDDIGEYDRAFAAFDQANVLGRSARPYDVATDIEFVRRIAAAFSAALIERFAGSGSASEVPVFVMGMARSGTTLAEQVLAAHSQVHGAGELTLVPELSRDASALTRPTAPFPESADQLRRSDFAALGEGYARQLVSRAAGFARITDKLPWNFLYAGLIHLMLPQARIIHCIRNPIDTCLSLYTTGFNDLPFANDLRDIAVYYKAYASLVDHWRAALPEGRVLEVRYEDLVGDIETQARRAIEHCGLPWEDRCLSFHAADRPVRTASLVQVRKPVYSTSVERWRRYEHHLGPLLDELGDAASWK